MKKIVLISLLVFFIISCKSKNISAVADVNNLNTTTLNEILNGENYDLAIINYFATYCSPCKKELPSLEKIHQKYKDKRVLLISLSTESDEMSSTISSMMKLLGVTYPVYYNSPADFFGDAISVLPVTYVLNSNNEVLDKIVGLFNSEKLEVFIDNYLENNQKEVLTSNNIKEKYYTSAAVRNGKSIEISFKAIPPYKLGGEEYPPLEFTFKNINNGSSHVLNYQKDGYFILFDDNSGLETIEGHLKAYACSDSNCFIIDEDIKISVAN